MTSRNLNQTWRDVVFKQYEGDHAADVPFPIRYLINAPEWKKDIFIEIPAKIDVPVFRQAVLLFARTRRLADDPAYKDDLIKLVEFVGEIRPAGPENQPHIAVARVITFEVLHAFVAYAIEVREYWTQHGEKNIVYLID
ncbi:hypothetical protein GE09DRAFT_1290374 [Coniochaeta sp. 2T2.1]|nr:hypothetical protein GE09DRAFT_1290374 [Coniochaeta sp. 2T2.1]